MKNRYFVSGDVAVIEIQNMYTDYLFYTIIDIEDLGFLLKHAVKLMVSRQPNTNYVSVKLKNKRVIPLHRLIMKAPKGMDVDHIYHNGLDNRKKHLRVCTHKENCNNKNKLPREKRVNPYYWHYRHLSKHPNY
jgi:hypothetical protein